MWIRSQGKTKLIKPEYIRINETAVENITTYDLCIKLGEYSSKEKALKVLDMIQSAIMGKRTETTHDFRKDIHITHNYFDSDENLVFQMPLDSEVEENE